MPPLVLNNQRTSLYTPDFVSFARRLLILFLVIGLGYETALAQTRKPTDSIFCVTPELPLAQRQQLDRLARLAFQLKLSSSKAFSEVTWVPIRPHIFRLGAGQGGFDLSRLNNVIALTNKYYLSNGVGIQFYFAGTSPDYIDDDALYSSFTAFSELALTGRDAPNAMNMYLVNAFSNMGLGGYAYFPDNGISTTRSFILANANYPESDLGNRLIPHELGHNFNLFHTFQGSADLNPELVTRSSGANCTTAGDLVCDTPADPYGRSGSVITTINGCPVYTGTATDPQGMTYSPSLTNIMSYYFPCAHDFTAGQYDRMQAGLALRQSHTAYSLNYPPSAVSAPTNLQAQSGLSQHVVLTWQDNAANEMGYFVERSSSLNGPFVAVGGTGPNGTYFTDTKAPSNGPSFYRVRPSNTTTGSISNITSVTANSGTACTPVFALGCTQGDGLQTLLFNGLVLNQQSGCAPNAYHETAGISATLSAGQTVQLSGQLLNTIQSEGVSIFLDVNRDGTFASGERLFAQVAVGSFSGSISLPNNVTAGPIGMRVIVSKGATTSFACLNDNFGETEDYTLTIVPTVCTSPIGLTTGNLTATSADLSWTGSNDAFSYELRWKDQTTATWNTVSNLTTPGYSLTGLSVGTGYQWQVRNSCANGGSTWSGQAFATSCPLPTSFSSSAVTSSSAQLTWSDMGLGTTYDLAWRPDYTSSWQYVQGLTTPTYSLTGLRSGTAYVWQVRNRCSPTVDNAFSSAVSFVTSGSCRPSFNSGCTDNDGLTSFVFNGITMSQNSDCSASSYRAFSSPVAPVIAGRPYSLSGLLLSNFYSEGVGIWLDLNRNNTFEASERVFVTGSYVTGSFSGSLTIPAGTAPGALTMRVVVAYMNTPVDACGTYSYGEAEDYELFVHSSNVTQITQWVNPSCLNQPLPLSFATTTPFGTNNVFTVQLSDGTGAFASPTTLSSLTNSTGGSLTITIPNTVPPGDAYQMRVVSSNPVITAMPTVPVRIMATCSCPVPVSLAASSVAGQTAALSWFSDATVSSYSLRWRLQSSATWTTVTGITATDYYLSSLSPTATYEWQVMASCQNGQQSAWSSVATFQTISCGMAALTPASVTLVGESPVSLTVTFTGAGPYSFNLYRNGISWATYTNIPSSSITLTTLAPSSSTFTIGSASNSCGNFATSGTATITILCGLPSSLMATSITSSSALLSWAGATNQGYEVRWRPINSNAWSTTTLSTLSTTPSVSATGLISLTNYEWQVRSVCSGGVASSFTPSYPFQTSAIPDCLTMVSTRSGLWTDPTVWSCNRIPNPGDNVWINAGHIVTIPANTTARANRLRQDGKLIFAASSANLRLGYTAADSQAGPPLIQSQ